jgi:hypothetical protein
MMTPSYLAREVMKVPYRDLLAAGTSAGRTLNREAERRAWVGTRSRTIATS